MEASKRIDGQWNVWAYAYAARRWQVVHVSRNRRAAIGWIMRNVRSPRWYVYSE